MGDGQGCQGLGRVYGPTSVGVWEEFGLYFGQDPTLSLSDKVEKRGIVPAGPADGSVGVDAPP